MLVQKIKAFFQSHGSFWQFVLYALLSGLASVVEFSTFALFNFLVFRSLKEVSFSWWILSYPGGTGGGLGGFLATVIAYITAQIFNFIVQRKKTFHAAGHVLRSAILYTIMVVAVWFCQMYFNGVMMQLLREPLGLFWGDTVSECLNMMLAFAIQFPLNKYVIMRGEKARNKPEGKA